MSHNRRKSPTVDGLLAELAKRPDRPIPTLCEDSATVEGLIDLLVVKGLITETDLVPYLNRYQSVVTGLVMLLVEQGIISEHEMDKTVLAYHFALRHCRPDASSEDIFESRRSHLKTLLESGR